MRALRAALAAALIPVGSAAHALDPGDRPSTTRDASTNFNRLGARTFQVPDADSLRLGAAPLSSLLLKALPSGKRAVEQGQSDDLTLAGTPMPAAVAAGSLTRADLAASRASAVAKSVVTSGYATAGDAGAGCVYVRGAPGGAGALQDALGAWWQLSSRNKGRAGCFGAVGDGVTNDAATLQAAATALLTPGPNSGGSLVLDSYLGHRINTPLLLPNAAQMVGDGGTSGLKCAVSGAACLTLIGSQAALYNMPLVWAGSSRDATSVGLQIGNGEQGGSPVATDVSINGFGTGLDVRSNVSGKLDHVQVTHSGDIGIRFRNVFNADGGDWSMTSVGVTNDNGVGRLISYESGGGLKVNNLKGLGGSIGFHLNIADGATTQDLLFTGSSIENSTVACMKLERQGTTGTFGNINIVGSQFAGCPTGVWARAGAINGTISGVTFSDITVPIRLDPGANNWTVGRNTFTGEQLVQDNRVAFTDETGFIDRNDTYPIQSSSNTTWSTAYRVQMAPFRAMSVRVFFEGVLQGLGPVSRDEEFLLTWSGSGSVAVKGKSSTTDGGAIGFRVDVSTPGLAQIQYRTDSAGQFFQGTATIVPVGKAVAVKRGG